VTNLVSQAEGRRQARISEYSVLIKICGSKKNDVGGGGDWRKFYIAHVIIFFPVKYSPGEEIKMDQACSVYRRKERCIQIIGRKP
jgi:hypothetical protein